MSEEEKQGKDHFKEGRRHFEKGGRKVLEQDLEKDQVQETDETAEEALTRILSAGFGAENSNREDEEEGKENTEQD